MKDLEYFADLGMLIVSEVIGEEKILPIKRPFSINTRAVNIWGKCRRNTNGTCEIEVSERILRDEIPDNSTMSTVIHEILHACVDGGNHNGTWKVYANKINKAYPEFNITRTTSAEFFGLSEEQKALKKYAIRCKTCGKEYHKTRLCNTIKHPEQYACGVCGGKLERIL